MTSIDDVETNECDVLTTPPFTYNIRAEPCTVSCAADQSDSCECNATGVRIRTWRPDTTGRTSYHRSILPKRFNIQSNSSETARIMWAFPKVVVLAIGWVSVGMHGTAAQQPPFPFGAATGDVSLPLGYGILGNEILLPQPMMFFGKASIAVTYNSNGYLKIVAEIGPPGKLNGFAKVYFMSLDTGNGGTDQNQIWLRVGNKTSDLNLARDIIADYGTVFNPQVVIVATWYKVEAFYQRAGPQNTFQLIMAYSDTGATYGIHAYTQLQFFQSDNENVASVEYINDFGVPFLSIATVNSNTAMNELQNGTNCNRTGIYVYQINAPCGNGIVQTGEQCDDGNTVDGDGCSSTCQLEINNCTITFNLYNSRTDSLVAPLTNGTIVASPPPCRRLNIEAVIPCAQGSNVTLELYQDSRLAKRKFERTSPYFLFGNQGRNVLDGTIKPGTYGIRARVANGAWSPFTNFTLGGRCD
jgi:cysteine-rich repeat protein